MDFGAPEVSQITFSVLDANNTAAAPGEVPEALAIGFTTGTAGTNVATWQTGRGYDKLNDSQKWCLMA